MLRGRKHSISSVVEDYLGFYLCENLQDYKIYLDVPISIPSNNSKNIYPDILVTKNGIIVGIVEVKTDLGYNRELEVIKKYCIKE